MRVDVSTDKYDKTYPWVGKGKMKGHIVLFTAPKLGTIIYTDEPNAEYVVGYWSDHWAESSFTAVCITLDSTIGGQHR